MTLSGWGRYPKVATTRVAPRDLAHLAALTEDGPLIARGAGRAYGDSAVSSGRTVEMRHFNRMIAFDPKTGVLVAEAGVLLADIIAAFLPRGWFPAVSPGTKFVTVGGMLAADVHGKNHHLDGSIAAFTDWVEVMGPGGEVLRCSPGENADLFHWTLGGMGLTGVILRAAIRLRRVETGWISQRNATAPDLESALGALRAAADAPYAVAWIDCLARGGALGRSLISLGRHATLADLPKRARAAPFHPPPRRAWRAPLTPPGWALNRWSMGAFNAAYWAIGRRKQDGLTGWDAFFYPLDAVTDWNRLYGGRGFAQTQYVLPHDQAADGLRALLAATATAGAGSFLAVLKMMGPGRGGLSFPQEGFTLTLDFPIRARTLALMNRLDDIARASGGRIYLAKDARMTAETLADTDPRAAAFADWRRARGLQIFASAQSERLGL